MRIILVLVASATGLLVTAYSLHWIGSVANSGCGCGTPVNRPSTASHFTVIMSGNGYNDSQIHGLPWPIMNVSLGQSVTIHVVNCDPIEPHGFSITHYVVGINSVQPNHCQDFSFVADQRGTFTIFCTIFCKPHVPWMQDGHFNVNP